MTKEENDIIKNQIFNKHSFSALGAISPSKEFCLPAMQEYADLRCKPLVEALEMLSKEENRQHMISIAKKYLEDYNHPK